MSKQTQSAVPGMGPIRDSQNNTSELKEIPKPPPVLTTPILVPVDPVWKYKKKKNYRTVYVPTTQLSNYNFMPSRK